MARDEVGRSSDPAGKGGAEGEGAEDRRAAEGRKILLLQNAEGREIGRVCIRRLVAGKIRRWDTLRGRYGGIESETGSIPNR